jgi:hypothetical protein
MGCPKGQKSIKIVQKSKEKPVSFSHLTYLTRIFKDF